MDNHDILYLLGEMRFGAASLENRKERTFDDSSALNLSQVRIITAK
jgi:hypothetical protein